MPGSATSVAIDLLVGQRAQGVEIDPGRRQRPQVAHLGPRQAAGAQRVLGRRRQRRAAGQPRRLEPSVDGAGRGGADLLADDRIDQRVEPVRPAPQRHRTDRGAGGGEARLARGKPVQPLGHAGLGLDDPPDHCRPPAPLPALARHRPPSRARPRQPSRHAAKCQRLQAAFGRLTISTADQSDPAHPRAPGPGTRAKPAGPRHASGFRRATDATVPSHSRTGGRPAMLQTDQTRSLAAR